MASARRRLAAGLVAGAVLAAFADQAASAAAQTQVQAVIAARRATAERIRGLRAELRTELQRARAYARRGELIAARAGYRAGDDPHHVRRHTRAIRRAVRLVRRDARLSARRLRSRLRALERRREALGDWLETWGVFRVCPVPGFTVIHDDFGEMVRLEGVPVHRHLGSDVSAPTGSAILAPFEGYAVASWSPLGGNQVTVRGAAGEVFNAHLSAYGRLGWVRAGTVVGYVGATGNATAPHDHLEWRPGGGAPVDPYPYLVASCVPR
jgi:murein DD-endopeptidase MepM/ murein hydrolase activator NlpD